MPKIEIINPLPGGMKFTSPDRAKHFCALGLATMSRGNRLLFTTERQAKINDQLSEDAEFDRNRGGMLYWNGARAQYVNGVDLAMFPPGCNVAFPKVGTRRAAKRYA